MNQDDLSQTPELFTSPKHWKAFLELAPRWASIRSQMYFKATKSIRDHFHENPNPGWVCEPWGNQFEDTKWSLNSSTDSLCLVFGWQYQLILYLPPEGDHRSEKINEAMKTPRFQPLFNALRADRKLERNCKLVECRNFKFGTDSDHNFADGELAWHAAHETESFVQQAVAKVERFTRSEEITQLLRELNTLGV